MTLKDTDGFILHGWMVNELHLEGGDLIAFALVHQFTQSDAGLYKGNTSYLSAWTGWSERTSRAHLLSLVEKGLIEEVRGRENNSPFCYYKLGKSIPQKFQGDPAKISKSTPQIFPEAPRKNCGENIHIIENTSVENTTTPTPSKFDFRKAMTDQGVEDAVADAWLEVRRQKKAVNTEISWNRVLNEIKKSGHSANYCIRMAVEKSWRGFEAAWLQNISDKGQGSKTILRNNSVQW